MKAKSEENSYDVISIVHWSGSAHMFLLQSLTWWHYKTSW